MKGGEVPATLKFRHHFVIWETSKLRPYNTMWRPVSLSPVRNTNFFHFHCQLFQIFAVRNQKLPSDSKLTSEIQKIQSNTPRFLDETELSIIWSIANPEVFEFEYASRVFEDVAPLSRVKWLLDVAPQESRENTKY